MTDLIERSKAIEVADLLERECQYDHGVSPRIAAALRALPAASVSDEMVERATLHYDFDIISGCDQREAMRSALEAATAPV